MSSSTWSRHLSPSFLSSWWSKSSLPATSNTKKKDQEMGDQQHHQQQQAVGIRQHQPQQQDIEEAPASLGTHHPRMAIGDPYHRKSSAAIHVVAEDDHHASELPLVDTNARSSATSTTRAMNKTPTEPKLLHPILLKIPLHLRFGFNGVLTNVLFMVVYNSAIVMFEHRAAVSTIYSVVYLFYIPLGHLFVSLLVFGWPEKYFSSLASNFPIGLTAIALGGLLTGYLDTVEFSDRIDDYLRDNFTFSRMPPRVTGDKADDSKNEFWSSLLVLIVTSVWTYVLSIYVNSRPTKSEKKEL